MKKKTEIDSFAAVTEKKIEKFFAPPGHKKKLLSNEFIRCKNCNTKNYYWHTIKQQSSATPVKSMVAGDVVFFNAGK